eukprot:m.236932 g.236932  ORF g.236932 m.236932 type:complete len:416 (-) comp15789_c0_seq4:1686-2933(-)
MTFLSKVCKRVSSDAPVSSPSSTSALARILGDKSVAAEHSVTNALSASRAVVEADTASSGTRASGCRDPNVRMRSSAAERTVSSSSVSARCESTYIPMSSFPGPFWSSCNSSRAASAADRTRGSTSWSIRRVRRWIVSESSTASPTPPTAVDRVDVGLDSVLSCTRSVRAVSRTKKCGSTAAAPATMCSLATISPPRANRPVATSCARLRTAEARTFPSSSPPASVNSVDTSASAAPAGVSTLNAASPAPPSCVAPPPPRSSAIRRRATGLVASFASRHSRVKGKGAASVARQSSSTVSGFSDGGAATGVGRLVGRTSDTVAVRFDALPFDVVVAGPAALSPSSFQARFIPLIFDSRRETPVWFLWQSLSFQALRVFRIDTRLPSLLGPAAAVGGYGMQKAGLFFLSSPCARGYI